MRVRVHYSVCVCALATNDYGTIYDFTAHETATQSELSEIRQRATAFVCVHVSILYICVRYVLSSLRREYIGFEVCTQLNRRRVPKERAHGFKTNVTRKINNAFRLAESATKSNRICSFRSHSYGRRASTYMNVHTYFVHMLSIRVACVLRFARANTLNSEGRGRMFLQWTSWVISRATNNMQVHVLIVLHAISMHTRGVNWNLEFVPQNQMVHKYKETVTNIHSN